MNMYFSFKIAKSTFSFMLFATAALPGLASEDASDLALSVSFTPALTNGMGWTSSGNLGNDTKDDHLYLKNQKAYIASPAFSQPLVQLALVYNASSGNPARTLAVIPVTNGCECADLAQNVPASESRATATFSWPRDLLVTSFVLRMSATGGSGNWHLYAAELRFAGFVAPPSELTLSPAAAATLAAAWRADGEAAFFHYRLVRETETPPTGVPLLAEGFDSVTNATRNTKDITSRTDELLPGWSGEKIMAPRESSGIVQIGTSEQSGLLVLPPLGTSGPVSLAFRAARVVSSAEGSVLPILAMSGGATNQLATVALGDALAWHRLDLVIAEPMRIAFHSTTNRTSAKRANGRVLLDEVRVLRDAVGPQTTFETVKEGTVTGANALTFAGLAPGAYRLFLAAATADGERSAEAEAHATLTADTQDDFGDDDRYAPLRLASLPREATPNGCWRHVHSPDPASLGESFHLQRFVDGTLDDSVTTNKGNTQSGGFYQWEAEPPGFGSYSTQGHERIFGLALENDMRQGMRSLTVEVGYGQWGTHASEPDLLRFEWALSKDRYAIASSNDWHAIDGGDFLAPITTEQTGFPFPLTNAVRRLEIPFRTAERGKRVREGDYHLLLRWTDTSPKKGANSALGLWHLRLIAETYGGFTVFCR